MLILAQSDTTVGFLGKDPEAINRAKRRKASIPVLQTLPSLKSLSRHTRTPRHFRSQIRRARLTTYIFANKRSFRVVSPDSLHHQVLEKFDGLFSSSANETNKHYDSQYAFGRADLIIKDERGLYEGKGSTIYKIGKTRKRRVR